MDVFGALADPIRRALLQEIAAGTTRVTDLALLHPISRPAVSKHLRLLTEAGLLVAKDRGRERHYTVVPEALGPVTALVDRLFTTVAGPLSAQSLDALETEVRRTVRERRTATRDSSNRQETA